MRTIGNIVEGLSFGNELKLPFNYSPVKVNTLLIIKSIWKKKKALKTMYMWYYFQERAGLAQDTWGLGVSFVCKQAKTIEVQTVVL